MGKDNGRNEMICDGMARKLTAPKLSRHNDAAYYPNIQCILCKEWVCSRNRYDVAVMFVVVSSPVMSQKDIAKHFLKAIPLIKGSSMLKVPHSARFVHEAVTSNIRPTGMFDLHVWIVHVE